MSIIRETFILCNGGGCQKNFGVDTRSLTAKQQRFNAHKNGWIYVGGKDLCPECKALYYDKQDRY